MFGMHVERMYAINLIGNLERIRECVCVWKGEKDGQRMREREVQDSARKRAGDE